jgi:23S rRNA (uracil1939-C5)-methyltransferase
VDAAAQLRLKRDIVIDALRRIAHVSEPAIVAAVAVPPFAYRTTARLGVESDGRLAYHRRAAAGLVTVDTCLVAHPHLEQLITTQRFPGAREVTLRVSAATGEQLSVVDPGRRGQAGAFISEDVGGTRWRVSATSFFQSGPAAAELLVDAVTSSVGDALPERGTLVDAYAGVGILGGVLARRAGANLEIIENQPAAAGDARFNLADLPARVVQVEVGQWRATPADVVVADPARPGLGRPGVRALTAAHPARLVLASCDPASLARDTNLLRDAGYRLAEVQVLDLFPHTAHVETVARFDVHDDGAAGSRNSEADEPLR